MPSGLTLWPFADDPHITREGFILRGPSAEIRAKVYRFLLQREIPSNVAPSVREHLEWHHENGSLIKIFTFRSLEHLTLQAFPPPAKRRAAAHISPQPAFTGVLPEPPVFTIYQEEPTCQCGVYAAQAARPPALEERSGLQTQAQVNVSHRPPFLSLVQEALRRVTAIWQTLKTCCTLYHPLAGNSYAHQARACQGICTEWKRWKMPSNSFYRGDNLLAARKGYAAMGPEKETVRFNTCHALFPFILSSLFAN